MAAKADIDCVVNKKGIPLRKLKMLKEAEDFLVRTPRKGSRAAPAQGTRPLRRGGGGPGAGLTTPAA